ncbi:MAG: phosphoglycerate kinase, partial [Metamycoplasmataceae bacterium]
ANNIKESAIGFLILEELKNLSKAVYHGQKPMVAIIGGAKVSDKIKVIANLIEKVDYLIIGGGMAYTFLKAQGFGIGTSLVEEQQIPLATQYLKQYSHKIILPIDSALSSSFSNSRPKFNTENSLEIPDGFMGLDIGPKTIDLFEKILLKAKTIIWNGPMGVAEFSNYKTGTEALASQIAELKDCFSIIGGGDSAAAVYNLGLEKYFSHISTGGGASLQFLEGAALPGIDAIQESTFVVPQIKEKPMHPLRVEKNVMLSNDEQKNKDIFVKIEDHPNKKLPVDETTVVETELLNKNKSEEILMVEKKISQTNQPTTPVTMNKVVTPMPVKPINTSIPVNQDANKVTPPPVKPIASTNTMNLNTKKESFFKRLFTRTTTIKPTTNNIEVNKIVTPPVKPVINPNPMNKVVTPPVKPAVNTDTKKIVTPLVKPATNTATTKVANPPVKPATNTATTKVVTPPVKPITNTDTKKIVTPPVKPATNTATTKVATPPVKPATNTATTKVVTPPVKPADNKKDADKPVNPPVKNEK